jgi:SAM-dependent methyltransferase
MPGGAKLRDWIFRGPRSHDELYGGAYFDMVERTTAQGAEVMAQSIVAGLHPSRVIDVGCGTGTLLGELRALGVEGHGLEYATAGLDACRERGLHVERFDLASDELPDSIGTFDVAISMEVGQQLPPDAAERYIDVLAALSSSIVFSSAVPGQGDRAPQNEQPHEYWVDLFAARRFGFDDDLTSAWRRTWAAAPVAPWFAANVLVFRREDG